MGEIGEETADGAFERFAAAVRNILDKARGEDIAAVTHGTVLTLFVARHNAHVAPFDLWASLGLPSYVLVDNETFVSDGEVHSFPG